jgi:hypothetical protein
MWWCLRGGAMRGMRIGTGDEGGKRWYKMRQEGCFILIDAPCSHIIDYVGRWSWN